MRNQERNSPQNESRPMEDEEEEENEILLPPPHQEKFANSTKPPSQYWKEIEEGYEIRQKEKEKPPRGRKRTENGTPERNTRPKYKEKAQEQQKHQDPNRPISWWYIPPKSPRRENEQPTSCESESESGGRRNRKHRRNRRRKSEPNSNTTNANPKRHIGKLSAIRKGKQLMWNTSKTNTRPHAFS